uniref:Uncharacterized protein n=1 Tax=Chaetoceros debilis TaxID=122233 RepID=A0A7S3VFN3_9STRA
MNLSIFLRVTIGISCIASTAFAFSISSSSTSSQIKLQSSQSSTELSAINRRQMLSAITVSSVSAACVLAPLTASARAPGSKDICASLLQIRDASTSLQNLLEPNNWNQYTVIDGEGRAGSTDGARRILGGIAPQSGMAAIDAAKKTPLYRIDVAFVTVRKAVLEGSDAWTESFDLDRFEELADRVVYNVSKSDGNFYSVLFAMKGGKMIEDIFVETRGLVKQGVGDLEEMIGLLKSAGAPCMD